MPFVVRENPSDRALSPSVALFVSERGGLGAVANAQGGQDLVYMLVNSRHRDAQARRDLHWAPRLSLADALDWVVDWYRGHLKGNNPRAQTLSQIQKYMSLAGKLASGLP